MALKSSYSYSADEKGGEIEDALDALDKLVDRVKVLYEQYFMGIQKQAPSHLHGDVERRIRELTQLQIRNTALRYRFATIQQKYGAYNTYWKRSVREIEAGRYVRDLSRLRRQAMASGEVIPPEIMAAMPKRMRDAVERDRAAALAEAQRNKRAVPEAVADESDTEPTVARVTAPPPPRRSSRLTTDPFEHAGEDDVAAALAGLVDEAVAAIESKPPAEPPREARRPRPPSRPPRPPTRPPPAAASPVPGMSEADTRALYAKYVKAREVVGDRSEGLSYEKLVRTLSSQAPKILEEHRASGVDFNVVIRDNKVVLKAKPRR